MHQPLHIGYASDKGGNSFQVNFNGKRTNLHGLFDYGIIEYKGLSLKDCLKNKKYSEVELTELNSGGIVDWAKESRHYLNEIYTSNNLVEKPYLEFNYSIIKSQILKAGLRLANILKKDFQE